MGDLGQDGNPRRSWRKNPDAVQANILETALQVFAEKGLSGARVEEIVARTDTSKRMIYYYFGDKVGLYRAALEEAYGNMRAYEANLNLSDTDPVMALRQLVGFTFRHHAHARDFVRLVAIENIHNAEHLQGSAELIAGNSNALLILDDILRRGEETGQFRSGLTALSLHWQISALCFFNVSNQATFARLFGETLFTEEGQRTLCDQVCTSILRYVLVDPNQELAPMIDSELHAFLAVWDGKWSRVSPNATPADRRAAFEVIAAEMALPAPHDVDARAEHWIESDAGPVRVRVYRHNSDQLQPVLIYMHGGAWMQGSPETHADITAKIAAANQQTVISVDYALAPERPFPAAFQQVLAVVRWTIAEASTLRVDPKRIAIGGDSAGGNLAAAVALAARDEGLPLHAQLLIYPACDFDQSRPSYAENANGPLLRVKGMDYVNAMYCPDTSLLHTDWRIAPLVANSHAGLPPTYMAVATHDPLRDSGLAYADALKLAGVEVVVHSGQGLIHGYLRAMEFCAASRKSFDEMCAWLSVQNNS